MLFDRRRPTVKINKKILLLLVLGLVGLTLIWWRQRDDSQPTHTGKSQASQQTKSSSSSSKPTEFNKQQYSVNDPSSLWVVVNKGRILPSDYVPTGLRQPTGGDSNQTLRDDAATALERLFNDAQAVGYDLVLYSGYRSYSYQISVYNGFVKSQGQKMAEQFSARAGHSEHQTGLAADVSSITGKCTLEQCFAYTNEGKWLAANSYKYGFVIRYQNGKENITGYEYEPWHLRYVGTELAAEINRTDQALEQFFNLTTYKLDAPYPDNPYQLKAGG